MPDAHVQVFDNPVLVGLNQDRHLDQALEFAAVKSQQPHGQRALGVGVFGRAQKVRRIAAAADQHDDIFGPQQIFQLPRKDVVKGEVVPDRRYERNIIRQRNTGQLRPSRHRRRFAQVGGDVRRRGR